MIDRLAESDANRETLIRRFSSFFLFFFLFFFLVDKSGIFINCQLGIIGKFEYISGKISYEEA